MSQLSCGCTDAELAACAFIAQFPVQISQTRKVRRKVTWSVGGQWGGSGQAVGRQLADLGAPAPSHPRLLVRTATDEAAMTWRQSLQGDTILHVHNGSSESYPSGRPHDSEDVHMQLVVPLLVKDRRTKKKASKTL